MLARPTYSDLDFMSAEDVMTLLKAFFVMTILGIVSVLGFIYSGLYPIGADDQHTKPVHWALETLRERSIARRIKQISVPALDKPEMLLAGGADYNQMCAGCHLKPGKASSDMSEALYPKPPNLSLATDQYGDPSKNAARQFWYIKHGIKASGMPAWGATHDDARIWDMVAFIQQMPSLTPEQYQILTAPSDGGMVMDRPSGM